MEFKKLNKSLGIISACTLFIILIVTYLCERLNWVNVGILDIKYFTMVTISCVGLLLLKTFIDAKEEKSVYLKASSVFIEIIVVLSLIIMNVPFMWPVSLFVIPITTVSFNFSRRMGLALLGIPLIVVILGFQVTMIEILYVFSILIFVCLTTYLVDKRINCDYSAVDEAKKVTEELGLNNLRIQQEMEELKKTNDGLESANQRLEDTNYKLNKQVAEFYTLQQISQAIATILDIKELLTLVNDVIIGVMGVNYSTVLLINEEGKMDVKISNISSEQALQTLRSNMDCEILTEVFGTGTPILDNNADALKYPFIKDRDINSLICIPLSSKNENYGLVLVEQKMTDAFNNEHLKILSIIGNQTSVALENVGLYEKMQLMATTDGLTKIYNRLYFNERISKEMAKADQGNYPVAISIFDIDHFKKFNDTYGHLFGDKVLKTIAKLGRDSIREQDTIARYGGEEFVILMPNTTLEEAFEIVENIRIKISECHVKEESISASVTASFGVGCYPAHGGMEAEVLSAADTALYKAKMDGRNCTRIFTESMKEK